MSPVEARKPGGRGDMSGLSSRLRALRQTRGLTLDALSAATGLDKGYLSRLERGLKAPSVSTVLLLAEMLDVPVAELFGERLAEHAVRVTRKADRTDDAEPGAATHGFAALSRDDAALDAFIIHPAAAFPDDVPPAKHAGDEFFFVLSGRIEMRFVDRGFVLDAGDCAQFTGSLAHRVRRVGAEPASALVVVARDRQRIGRIPAAK